MVLRHRLLFAALLFFFGSTLAAALELRDISAADEKELHHEFARMFITEPTQKELEEAVGFLMKKDTYESVSFERKTNREFVLVGHPFTTIEEIRFSGVDAFSKSRLLEVLELQPGKRFDRKKAIAAGEKLKQFYGENGYFNTVINLTFPRASNQNIILQFAIQENKPCRLESLELKTANAVLKERLSNHLSRFLKKPLTESLINSLTKRANEYFIDYRYLTAELVGPEVRYNDEKTAASVAFEIKDPYRWEFFFDGNKFSSQLDILRALDWNNRDRKNLDPANEGAERIRRDYLSKGFSQVQVDFQVQSDPNQPVKRVFYTINEGFRVRLRKIEIQGRISRSPSYYANFIISNSSPLIERGYYNRRDLDDGFKNLTTDLRNQGYLKARIQSSRIEFDNTKQFATVYVLLDEGPLTLVQSVDIEGNHFVSNYELVEVLGLTTNSPLRLTDLESGIERVKAFYHKQGFLEMKILNESDDIVKYNESGTLARLQLRLYEGPRVRVASVRIEGNTITQSWVVLKEASFHTGEVLTPDKIDEARVRLNRTGLFAKVDVHTLEENTAVSERTVVVSVTDRDPGLLRFGAGATSERNLTVRGFTTLSYNNLFGTARAISGRFQLSDNIALLNYVESDATVGYLEPFLFDSLTRGRVNFNYSQHVFDYNSNADLTEITVSNKLTFNIERDFNRHWRGSWKVWSREEEKDFERNGNPVKVLQPNGTYISRTTPDLLYVATMGPILEIDYRDNPFLPSSGSLTRLIGEYSDPVFGSTDGVNFVHTEVHELYYIPLVKDSKRWVWANQARAGYLANVSSAVSSGVPVSHSFFLGGVDTVRGYDISQGRERIPPDWEVPVAEGNQILVQHDSHYYLGKTELRFPISGDHGGVIFYDVGTVQITGFNFSNPVCVAPGQCYSYSPWRQSIGIGYRYNTPVGAVSLDLAFKINPQSTPDGFEAPFRVHFSIGSF